MQPILVGTNFSDASAAATREAVQLARALQAPLVLVHEVEPIEHPDTADPDTRRFHRELIEKAHEHMAAELKVCPSDVDVSCRVELGQRVLVLAALTESYQPRLVVLGNRGEGESSFSVSRRLLAQIRFPTLLVPAPVARQLPPARAVELFLDGLVPGRVECPGRPA